MSAVPVISVLVPVRGDGAFLEQALHSLQAQACVAWEALLCPLDGTAQARVSVIELPDPRMHRIAHAGADEARALASAGEQARGSLLCVLDGDDLLEPQALATLRAVLDAQPATGMVYSRHVLIDAGGAQLGPGPLCELQYSPDALLMDFMTGPLRLMRTEACLRSGGFASAFPNAGDYDLCLRLSETTDIAHVARPLYRRRVHPASPLVLRWAERIEDSYRAFAEAVRRRGLDTSFDCALEIDSWHILQPLRPFGGAGNWR